MRHGAFEYLFKPLDLPRLKEVVAQALELGRLMREPAVVADDAPPIDPDDIRGDAIVGRCPAMGEVYKAIGRVTDQNVIVLAKMGDGRIFMAKQQVEVTIGACT